jgi:hypothetical protein
LILSPFKEGPFKNQLNRRLFAERIRNSTKSLPIQGASVAKSFYISSASAEIQPSGLTSYVGIAPGAKVTVVGPTSPTETEGKYIRSLIEEALAGSGLEIDYITAPDAFSDEELSTNKVVDIRVDSVDIGGYFLNFATKMMFCSKLGIAFPDPHGKMCRLVTDYESADRLPDDEYSDRFNRILHEDACVVPVAHRSMNWLVTKDLDQESLPPVVIHPQLEKIRASEN